MTTNGNGGGHFLQEMLRDALREHGAEIDEPCDDERRERDERYKIDEIIRAIPHEPYRGGIGLQVTGDLRIGKKRREFLAQGRRVCSRLVYLGFEDLRIAHSPEKLDQVVELLFSAIRVWLHEETQRQWEALDITVRKNGELSIESLEARIAEDAEPVRETVGHRLTGKVDRFNPDKRIGLIEATLPGGDQPFLFFFHVNHTSTRVADRLASGETGFEVRFENTGFENYRGDEPSLPSAQAITEPLAANQVPSASDGNGLADAAS